MAWVRAANQHRAIAEEIILKELIYQSGIAILPFENCAPHSRYFSDELGALIFL